MAQENSDMSTKFSTLNVNAVEFVPSFGFSGARGATNVEAAAAAPPDGVATPMEVSEANSTPATPKSSPATTPESVAGSETTNNTDNLTTTVTTNNPAITANNNNINNNNNNNLVDNVAAPTEPAMDTAAVGSPTSSQGSPMDASPTSAVPTTENDIDISPTKDLTTVADLLAISGKQKK